MKEFVVNKETYRTKTFLTKEEVNDLKRYCDNYLAVGTVEIHQLINSDKNRVTKVMVTGLPETLEDITDISSW